MEIQIYSECSYVASSALSQIARKMYHFLLTDLRACVGFLTGLAGHVALLSLYSNLVAISK